MFTHSLDAQRTSGKKITAQKETEKGTKSDFFLESKSQFGFDETVAKFTAIAEQKTWKISATHDLQQTMKTHGKEVLPVKVFAICHPKHSSKILEKDDERIISSMMPCRVSIYMKSDGKTYISRMNSIAMAQNFDGVIREVMTESALEVEEMIRELVIEK
ncbi:MAG: DUF302 domain-containing protein [Saprospiraceae bacterium]|nr:DUF302 domain-containing protein [Saprospiraceae bacterium]